MIVADRTPWGPQSEVLIEDLKGTYQRMMSTELPRELRRVAQVLDEAEPRGRPGTQLAVVAEADADHRALATALLEETSLRVIECASAEAALAVLVQEADKTVFLLADQELAGERDGQSLAQTVRLLWPGIHVVVANQEAEAGRRLDESGAVNLSRPWRGLDILVEAERALARAA